MKKEVFALLLDRFQQSEEAKEQGKASNKVMAQTFYDAGILVQHVIVPNQKDSDGNYKPSCFTEDQAARLKQAYFDTPARAAVKAWYKPKWDDVESNPIKANKLGYVYTESPVTTKHDNYTSCTKGNHAHHNKQCGDIISNIRKATVALLEDIYFKLEQHCHDNRLDLEAEIAKDPVLANSVTPKGIAVTDSAAAKSEKKKPLKPFPSIRSKRDSLMKVVTQHIGAVGGSKTDDGGALFFEDDMEVPSEIIEAYDALQIALVIFDENMRSIDGRVDVPDCLGRYEV